MEKSLTFSSRKEKTLENEYKEILPSVEKKLKLVLTLINGFIYKTPQIVDKIIVDSFSIELYKLICQSSSLKKRGRLTRKILVFMSCLISNLIFIKNGTSLITKNRNRILVEEIPQEGQIIPYLTDSEGEND